MPWLVRLLLVVVLLVVAVVVVVLAVAEPVVEALYVGRSGLPRITLYRVPCAGDALEVVRRAVRPEWLPHVRGGQGVFGTTSGERRSYSACWLRLDPPYVSVPLYVVIFADGDYMALPADEWRDHSML